MERFGMAMAFKYTLHAKKLDQIFRLFFSADLITS